MDDLNKRFSKYTECPCEVAIKKSWLTVGIISGYCMVSEATVRRWIKSGILVAIRLPSGHYRVTIADFRDFLKRNDIPIGGAPFSL